MYMLRLDDASEYMDTENWSRIEVLLKNYEITPVVGIIPDNQDPDLTGKFKFNKNFWKLAASWQRQGWHIAQHGYQHRFTTQDGGINPVNPYSEFAGVPLDIQKDKLEKGYKILETKGILPKIFFAPAHTFDLNTVEALKEVTPIRIIHDTVAADIYYDNDIYYIPQQSGSVRRLPFKITTFCCHPNNMLDNDFMGLEEFLIKTKGKWAADYSSLLKKRKAGRTDKLLRKLYFLRKGLKNYGII